MLWDFLKSLLLLPVPFVTPKVDLVRIFASVFGLQTLTFIGCQFLRDNSIADIVWPLLFIIPNVMILQQNDNWNERTTLVLAMVTIWALRLCFHLLRRHVGEDKRYAELRLKWETHGRAFYYIMSFVFLFMVPAACALVVNSSAMHIMLKSKDESLEKADYMGALMSFTGFLMEVIADHQLSDFRNKQGTSGRVMKGGLWRFSRHPNYFGEALQWWGIYVIAAQVSGGWKTIYSAITMTILVRFVTGVPPLEFLEKNNPEYQQYKKETNVFVPMPPNL